MPSVLGFGRPHWTLVAAVGLVLVVGLAALALALTRSGAGPREPAEPRATAGDTRPVEHVRVFGRSVRGRALVVRERGYRGAPRRVLVVGCVHGNECAGRAVTRRLASIPLPPDVHLWLVHDANPDGARRGTRQNARGVDPNRNFPYRWRRLDRPGGVFWSGPRALSEPETRALAGLIARVRPDTTLWYHQRMRLVDLSGGDEALQRRYAGLVGLPARRLQRPPGSVSSWQNGRFPGSTAFVVELPAGALSPAATARHARAVLALATAPAAFATQAPPPVVEPHAEPAAVAVALRPAIRWRPIFFPARRRVEMAAYARRHYGLATWRLRQPRVIVEHFSVTATADAVFNVFAPDRRDPELRELPGTCAHFVVGRDGGIEQLVNLSTMCRHAVGLNHVAIGIEHVGFTDRQVMGNPRQLTASLRLTRWLRCAYGIQLRHVIGHAETLSSPFHLERIARLRGQTHSDFRRPAMNAYRGRLARLPCSG